MAAGGDKSQAVGTDKKAKSRLLMLGSGAQPSAKPRPHSIARDDKPPHTLDVKAIERRRPRWAASLIGVGPWPPGGGKVSRPLGGAEEALALQAETTGVKRPLTASKDYEQRKKRALEETVVFEPRPEEPHRVGVIALTMKEKMQRLKNTKGADGGKVLEDASPMVQKAFGVEEKKKNGCRGAYGYLYGYSHLSSSHGGLDAKKMQDRALVAAKLLPKRGAALEKQMVLFEGTDLPVDLAAAKKALQATDLAGKFSLKDLVEKRAERVQHLLRHVQSNNFAFRSSEAQEKNAEAYAKASEELDAALIWWESVARGEALQYSHKAGKALGIGAYAVQRHGRKVVHGFLHENASEHELLSSAFISSHALKPLVSASRGQWNKLEQADIDELSRFEHWKDLGQCREVKPCETKRSREICQAYVDGIVADPFAEVGGKRSYCLGCNKYIGADRYSHNVECVGDALGRLRIFESNVGARTGMKLEYEHDVGKKSVSLKMTAPIHAIARDALWSSFWQADSVQVAWRVVALPRAKLPGVKFQDASDTAPEGATASAASSSTGATAVMKKPASAYFLWSQSARDQICRELGTKSMPKVATRSGAMWKAMSATDKAPWQAKAKAQKEAFENIKATDAGVGVASGSESSEEPAPPAPIAARSFSGRNAMRRRAFQRARQQRNSIRGNRQAGRHALRERRHALLLAKRKAARDEQEQNKALLKAHNPQFTMRDSLDVPIAPQPWSFKLSLKREQLHTLAWMYQREHRAYAGSVKEMPKAYCSSEVVEHRFGSSEAVLQVKIDRTYEGPRGGILGDVVGYGKTACMIALVSETRGEKMFDDLTARETELRKQLVFTTATLIITPPNLFGQWREEFKKFNDADLKILEVVDFHKMKTLRVKDIVEADVVLISFRFFFSEAYQRAVDAQVHPGIKIEDPEYKADMLKKQRASAAKAKAAAARPREDTGKKGKNSYSHASSASTAPMPASSSSADPHLDWYQRMLERRNRPVLRSRFTKSYKQLKQKRNYLAERFVKTRRLTEQQLGHLPPCQLKDERTILEQFHWRRVVFDEFHEVLKIKQGVPHYALRQLSFRYGWGLTATPPLDSTEGVSDMASLLHVHVSPTEEACRHFLQDWVRSNAWDMASIPSEEHWHPVFPTRTERALYLNQKNALEQSRRAGQNGLFQQEKLLLMLCTHFSPDGTGHASDAATAVKNTQRQQRESLAGSVARIQTLESAKAVLTEKQAAYESLDGLCESSMQHLLVAHLPLADVRKLTVQLLKFAGDDVRRDGLLAKVLEGDGALAFVRGDEKHKDGRPGMCTLCDEVRSLGEAIVTKNREIGRAKSRQQDSEASIRFFEGALQALQSDTKQTLECPVCLCDIAPKDRSITRCGHVHHEACIKDVIRVHKACPQCRNPLTLGCITRVQSEPMPTKSCSKSSSKEDDLDVKRYGSKFAAVLQCIRDIRSNEPNTKVIVFLQWDQLAKEVERALTAAQLSPLQLRGATRHREKMISDFVDGTSFQCLVLSLEQSPSGMNLTAANHVLLVHPMHAENHADAVACERQAIGRIRRQGQLKTCHVHRFFTHNTIEEDLVNKNHAEGKKKDGKRK